MLFPPHGGSAGPLRLPERLEHLSTTRPSRVLWEVSRSKRLVGVAEAAPDSNVANFVFARPRSAVARLVGFSCAPRPHPRVRVARQAMKAAARTMSAATRNGAPASSLPGA